MQFPVTTSLEIQELTLQNKVICRIWQD